MMEIPWRFRLIFFFVFGVNQVHCFDLNPGVQGQYLLCIVWLKSWACGEYLIV